MAELRKMVRHATVKQTRQASTKTLKVLKIKLIITLLTFKKSRHHSNSPIAGSIHPDFAGHWAFTSAS